MKKEIEMVFEKATKNTFRYMETAEEVVIGILYIQKNVFEGNQPEKIKVTIEWE